MTQVVTIERVSAAPVTGGATLLAFAGADGAPAGWRLLSGGAVIGRGDDLAELPEQKSWVRVVLAVPGSDVAMHWLTLDGDPTPAQAAAAARLRLADEIAGPIEAMHVAAGRRENKLTAIAAVPAVRMQAWLDAARGLGMEPDVVIPAPLLLMAPGEGLVSYRAIGAPGADYRGVAQAFAIEDELAALLTGDARVTEIDEDVREAGFGPALADPAINLRQGAFAPRRERVIDRTSLRRLFLFGLILLLVSLAIEITAIVRTSQAADRIEAEANELRAAIGSAPGGAAPGGGFGIVASALFDAVRDTPNVELTRIAYQPDGTLRASLLADSQATLDGVRTRIESRGVQASGGLPTTIGGRAAAELTMRARR